MKGGDKSFRDNNSPILVWRTYKEMLLKQVLHGQYEAPGTCHLVFENPTLNVENCERHIDGQKMNLFGKLLFQWRHGLIPVLCDWAFPTH